MSARLGRSLVFISALLAGCGNSEKPMDMTDAKNQETYKQKVKAQMEDAKKTTTGSGYPGAGGGAAPTQKQQ